jgi:hypothetical protein
LTLIRIRSSEKWKKIQSSETKTFNLVPKQTFDLVKFDLLTPSQNSMYQNQIFGLNQNFESVLSIENIITCFWETWWVESLIFFTFRLIRFNELMGSLMFCKRKKMFTGIQKLKRVQIWINWINKKVEIVLLSGSWIFDAE